MHYTLADFPQVRRFATLPPDFYTERPPTPLCSPTLAAWNSPLAESLGLDPDPQQHPDLPQMQLVPPDESAAWAGQLQCLPVNGIPMLDETLWFHPRSGSLIARKHF